MKKILVISPSGEVYDHDCVRWYSGMGFREAPDHYHNIGDAFVFDSSLKLLRYAQFNGMNIRNPTDADIERYNTEYDYAFLRGSNYLHPAMDWENAPAVLAKLRIPVIAFGIGAQAPSKGPLVLNEATRRVLALIADRSVSMGVRGAYTADVLWSLGIRNARIVGCPTVFRNNDPALRIDLPPLETVRDVAYTVKAFLRVGAVEEARAGFAWLTATIRRHGGVPRTMYALDGTLLRAPEMQGVHNFRPDEMRLVPVQVAQWGPLVFANVDGKAPGESSGRVRSRRRHVQTVP